MYCLINFNKCIHWYKPYPYQDIDYFYHSRKLYFRKPSHYLTSPEAHTLSSYHYRVGFPVLELYLNETNQYTLFCIYIILLRRVFWRFIHVAMVHFFKLLSGTPCTTGECTVYILLSVEIWIVSILGLSEGKLLWTFLYTTFWSPSFYFFCLYTYE